MSLTPIKDLALTQKVKDFLSMNDIGSLSVLKHIVKKNKLSKLEGVTFGIETELELFVDSLNESSSPNNNNNNNNNNGSNNNNNTASETQHLDPNSEHLNSNSNDSGNNNNNNNSSNNNSASAAAASPQTPSSNFSSWLKNSGLALDLQQLLFNRGISCFNDLVEISKKSGGLLDLVDENFGFQTQLEMFLEKEQEQQQQEQKVSPLQETFVSQSASNSLADLSSPSSPKYEYFEHSSLSQLEQDTKDILMKNRIGSIALLLYTTKELKELGIKSGAVKTLVHFIEQEKNKQQQQISVESSSSPTNSTTSINVAVNDVETSGAALLGNFDKCTVDTSVHNIDTTTAQTHVFENEAQQNTQNHQQQKQEQEQAVAEKEQKEDHEENSLANITPAYLPQQQQAPNRATAAVVQSQSKEQQAQQQTFTQIATRITNATIGGALLIGEYRNCNIFAPVTKYVVKAREQISEWLSAQKYLSIPVKQALANRGFDTKDRFAPLFHLDLSTLTLLPNDKFELEIVVQQYFYALAHQQPIIDACKEALRKGNEDRYTQRLIGGRTISRKDTFQQLRVYSNANKKKNDSNTHENPSSPSSPSSPTLGNVTYDTETNEGAVINGQDLPSIALQGSNLVVVNGVAGTGKTYLCEMLAIEQNVPNALVINVPLRDLAAENVKVESIEDLLKFSVGDWLNKKQIRTIALGQMPLILCLDGFDEVQWANSNSNVGRFLHDFVDPVQRARNSEKPAFKHFVRSSDVVIVSSREERTRNKNCDIDNPNANIDHWNLLLWDNNQVLNYSKKWFTAMREDESFNVDGAAMNVVHALRAEHMQHLSGLPLFVNMICEIRLADRTRLASISPSSVFEELTDLFWKRSMQRVEERLLKVADDYNVLDTKVTPELFHSVMKEAALAGFKQLVDPEAEDFTGISFNLNALPNRKPPLFAVLLASAGLLHFVNERKARFPHRSFVEFLCAKHAAENPATSFSQQENARTILWTQKFATVWLLLADMIRRSSVTSSSTSSLTSAASSSSLPSPTSSASSRLQNISLTLDQFVAHAACYFHLTYNRLDDEQKNDSKISSEICSTITLLRLTMILPCSKILDAIKKKHGIHFKTPRHFCWLAELSGKVGALQALEWVEKHYKSDVSQDLLKLTLGHALDRQELPSVAQIVGFLTQKRNIAVSLKHAVTTGSLVGTTIAATHKNRYFDAEEWTRYLKLALDRQQYDVASVLLLHGEWNCRETATANDAEQSSLITNDSIVNNNSNWDVVDENESSTSRNSNPEFIKQTLLQFLSFKIPTTYISVESLSARDVLTLVLARLPPMIRVWNSEEQRVIHKPRDFVIERLLGTVPASLSNSFVDPLLVFYTTVSVPASTALKMFFNLEQVATEMRIRGTVSQLENALLACFCVAISIEKQKFEAESWTSYLKVAFERQLYDVAAVLLLHGDWKNDSNKSIFQLLPFSLPTSVSIENLSPEVLFTLVVSLLPSTIQLWNSEKQMFHQHPRSSFAEKCAVKNLESEADQLLFLFVSVASSLKVPTILELISDLNKVAAEMKLENSSLLEDPLLAALTVVATSKNSSFDASSWTSYLKDAFGRQQYDVAAVLLMYGDWNNNENSRRLLPFLSFVIESKKFLLPQSFTCDLQGLKSALVMKLPSSLIRIWNTSTNSFEQKSRDIVASSLVGLNDMESCRVSCAKFLEEAAIACYNQIVGEWNNERKPTERRKTEEEETVARKTIEGEGFSVKEELYQHLRQEMKKLLALKWSSRKRQQPANDGFITKLLQAYDSTISQSSIETVLQHLIVATTEFWSLTDLDISHMLGEENDVGQSDKLFRAQQYLMNEECWNELQIPVDAKSVECFISKESPVEAFPLDSFRTLEFVSQLVKITPKKSETVAVHSLIFRNFARCSDEGGKLLGRQDVVDYFVASSRYITSADAVCCWSLAICSITFNNESNKKLFGCSSIVGSFVALSKYATTADVVRWWIGAIINIAYNNESNKKLFGCSSIRDALVTVSKYATSADAVVWWSNAISTMSRNNESNKKLFGCSSIVDSFVALSKYATSADAVEWWSQAINKLTSENYSNQELFGCQSIVDSFTVVSKYATSANAVQWWSNAIHNMMTVESNKKLFGCSSIRDSLVVVSKYTTSADAVRAWSSAINSITANDESNKKLFGCSSIRDSFVTLSKYATSADAVQWWSTATSNMIFLESNKKFFVCSSIRDSFVTLSQYATTSDAARAWSNSIDSFTSNNESKKLFGCSSIRDSLVVVSKYATTSNAVRAWSTAINNMAGLESNVKLFGCHAIVDAFVAISKYATSADAVRWWSSAISNMTSLESNKKLFGCSSIRDALVTVSKYATSFGTFADVIRWWVSAINNITLSNDVGINRVFNSSSEFKQVFFGVKHKLEQMREDDVTTEAKKSFGNVERRLF